MLDRTLDVVDPDGAEAALVAMSDAEVAAAAMFHAAGFFARDRADTLLYRPAVIRADRIADLARRTGTGERFVRMSLPHRRNMADGIGA